MLSSTPGHATDRVDRGQLLLTQYCAGCHAVGRSDESPLPAAPPLRSLGSRLDMDELFNRMQEGLFSGHRDMPLFRFSRRDARAVRSYLNTIQE